MPTSDNERLLSCPFCGPGQSMVDTYFDDMSKRWAVGCGRCGSSSGRSVHAEGSKEAAIKSWNTRALTAALSDQIVVPSAENELRLVRSQLAECHKEIFKLREALLTGGNVP